MTTPGQRTPRTSTGRLATRFRSCVFALLATSAAAPVHAGTASFMCAKAKTWTEKTICASNRLSAFDLQMAVARAKLLKGNNARGQSALEDEQGRWWNALAECRSTTAPDDCIAGRYQRRIAALESRPQQPSARATKNTIAPIATAGRGWTRDLSRYQRPLRACIEESPTPIAKLLSAWPAGDNESAGLLLSDTRLKEYVCVAHLEGHKVFRFDERMPGEKLPAAGPVYHLGGESPPVQCPGATQLHHVNGQPAGGSSDADC